MRRFKGLLFICALALFLAGCSFAGSGGSGTKSVPPDSAILSVSAEPEAAGEPEEPAPSGRPSKEEVLAAREKALEGMSQGQIDRLREVVIAANLKLENGYLNDGLFERLEDPDSLAWNYFDQAGEIQTGWAYDGDLDMEAVCAAENLTEDAFYAKYGRGISETNDYTADDFISLMEELAETVDSEDLKADLQYMAAAVWPGGFRLVRDGPVYGFPLLRHAFLLRLNQQTHDSGIEKTTMSASRCPAS